ncbi:MAG: transferase [Lachnospiraceae bacterium]|nr:transferase [Lachnospiraceae bacterium]
MIILDGRDNLENNLFSQLSSYWGKYDTALIREGVDATLDRLDTIFQCLNKRTNKYIWKQAYEPEFSPYNSVQYSIFLYLLSNSIYNRGGMTREADIIYYLNKIMHSCDWYYPIELPAVFYAEHPVGSVMGRAKYGDRFFFYQGCTVGGQRNKQGTINYPEIGNNVLMYAHSSIIGNAKIGNNVIISAGCMVKNDVVPDNALVFGSSPNLIIKIKEAEEIREKQRSIWTEFE